MILLAESELDRECARGDADLLAVAPKETIKSELRGSSLTLAGQTADEREIDLGTRPREKLEGAKRSNGPVMLARFCQAHRRSPHHVEVAARNVQSGAQGCATRQQGLQSGALETRALGIGIRGEELRVGRQRHREMVSVRAPLRQLEGAVSIAARRLKWTPTETITCSIGPGLIRERKINCVPSTPWNRARESRPSKVPAAGL